MKATFSVIALFFTLNVFAGSGLEAVKIVLEQNEVEGLEKNLQSEGYTLSKIEDVYATRGVRPRCPCTKLELTFSRGMVGSGSEVKKVYSVDARGFGNSLQVTISEEK